MYIHIYIYILPCEKSSSRNVRKMHQNTSQVEQWKPMETIWLCLVELQHRLLLFKNTMQFSVNDKAIPSLGPRHYIRWVWLGCVGGVLRHDKRISLNDAGKLHAAQAPGTSSLGRTLATHLQKGAKVGFLEIGRCMGWWLTSSKWHRKVQKRTGNHRKVKTRHHLMAAAWPE